MHRITMRGALAAVAALAAAALTVTACGSDAPSDADSVRATINHFHTTLFAGDPAACADLTAAGRAQLSSRYWTVQQCEGLVPNIGAHALAGQRAASVKSKLIIFANDQRKAVVVDADIDTPRSATGADNGRPAVLLKDRASGRWQIDDLG